MPKRNFTDIQSTIHSTDDQLPLLKKRKLQITEINLLNISQHALKQLNVNGITIQFYKAINRRHKNKPFRMLNDVVSFFIQYEGKLINTKHIKMWNNKNIVVKIHNFIINDKLLNVINNQLKFLKYNRPRCAQNEYKMLTNTNNCIHKYKKYNNTKKTLQKYTKFKSPNTSEQIYKKYKIVEDQKWYVEGDK